VEHVIDVKARIWRHSMWRICETCFHHLRRATLLRICYLPNLTQTRAFMCTRMDSGNAIQCTQIYLFLGI